MSYEVIHNPGARRFEIHLDGHMAYEEYVLKGGVIDYQHTIVPQALGGRGLGSFLVKYGLDYARDQGLKVQPTCSFVKTYIDRHAEYQANSVVHGAKT